MVLLTSSQMGYVKPQFGNTPPHTFSFACTPIEYYSAFGEILRGQHSSAFFWRYANKPYLVSALHCFSGRNVLTGTHLSPSAFEPSAIKVWLTLEVSDKKVTREPLNLELYQDGTPMWMTDPEFKTFHTDIAAVPLPLHLEERGRIVCLNDDPDEDLYAQVGADCFVVGYPSNLFGDPYLPIWRRGSFAYEPGAPLDGKPIFLVDAATSPGMSGSPIIQRWFGPAPIRVAGQIEVHGEKVVTSRFVGVYGGRIDDSLREPIGYGWYANRLPLICRGAHEHVTVKVPSAPNVYYSDEGNLA